MPLAAWAKYLFGPPTPEKEAKQEQQQRRMEEERRGKKRSPLFKPGGNNNNNDLPTAPKRSKRNWPPPLPAARLEEKLKAEKLHNEEVGKGTGKNKGKEARCCGLNCACPCFARQAMIALCTTQSY